MPITRSAIKAMRQSRTRQARNLRTKNEMKTLIKDLAKAMKAGRAKDAEKMMPQVVSAIDTAAKKNLIHYRNAARKKSRLQTALHKLTVKKV